MKQCRNFGGRRGQARGQIHPPNIFFGYVVEEEQIRKSGDGVGDRDVFTCILRTGSNRSSSSL